MGTVCLSATGRVPALALVKYVAVCLVNVGPEYCFGGIDVMVVPDDFLLPDGQYMNL